MKKQSRGMNKFIKEYGIPEYDAGVLTQTVGLADYFEETVAAGASGKGASNWIMGELLRSIKENIVEIGSVSLTPNALAGLIALIEKGVISSSTAKDVFGKTVSYTHLTLPTNREV